MLKLVLFNILAGFLLIFYILILKKLFNRKFFLYAGILVVAIFVWGQFSEIRGRLLLSSCNEDIKHGRLLKALKKSNRLRNTIFKPELADYVISLRLSADLYYEIGKKLYNFEKLQSAEVSFQESLKLFDEYFKTYIEILKPHHAEILNKISHIYSLMKKHKQALLYTRAALRLSPDNYLATITLPLNLVNAYNTYNAILRNRIEKAFKKCLRIIKTYDKPMLLYNYGVYLTEIGKIQKGISLLKRASDSNDKVTSAQAKKFLENLRKEKQ